MPTIPYPNQVPVVLSDFLGAQPYVGLTGAVPDCRSCSDAAINASSTTLTSATANWGELIGGLQAGSEWGKALAGKFIAVKGAGVAGADLITTIASWTDAGTLVLADAASTSVTGAVCIWGTDTTTAMQAAWDTYAAKGVVLRLHFGSYLVGNLTVPSNLHLIGSGKEGSKLVCIPGSMASDTPWIANSEQIIGNANIILEHCGFDGTSSWQTATRVDILNLKAVSRFSVRHCRFDNAILRCIGGHEWNEALIEDNRFENWLPSNVTDGDDPDFSGFGGAVQCAAEYGAGQSSAITVSGCLFEGRTSDSTCLKLSGSATNKISDITISENAVFVGGVNYETLGIELWSPQTDPLGYEDFVITGNKVTGPSADSSAFGISVAGSGGQHGSITGNKIRNCQTLSIEIASVQNCSVTGNNIRASGQIVIDSNYGPCKNITITGNTFSYPKAPKANPTVHPRCVRVYGGRIGGASNDIESIIVSANVFDLSEMAADDQAAGVQIESNYVGATVSHVQVVNNTITGMGNTGHFGVLLSENAGTLERCLVSENMIDSVYYAIYQSGDYNRYFSNHFGSNIAALYAGIAGANDQIVDINGAEGTHFAPRSLAIRGRSVPTLDTDGSIEIAGGGDTMHLRTNPVDGTESNPNVVVLNKINFGGEKQGGILSVNSKWDGNPNWSQTSGSLFTRALFVVLGADRFAVKFGDATNTQGSEPGTHALRITDSDQEIVTGLPLFVMETAASIRAGSGDPEGSVTAAAGSIYLRTSGHLYVKASGSGNTGWVQNNGLWAFIDANNIGTPFFVRLPSDRTIQFSSTTSYSGTQDVAIGRDSAGVLHVQDGFGTAYRDIKVRDAIVDSATASRAAYLDASKRVKASAATDTELGYLSGVSSAIQTQLGNRYTKTEVDSLIAAAIAGLITASHQHTASGNTSDDAPANPHHHTYTSTTSTAF